MSHQPHWANSFENVARESRKNQERKAYEDAPVHEAAPAPLSALADGLSSPPVALAPERSLHLHLPALVQNYLKCWQKFVCGRHDLKEPQKPRLTVMAKGAGTSEHDALLLTASPVMTNKIFLVDNGPGRHLDLAGAGPLIWIDRDPVDIGARYLRFTDVSGPYPKLDLLCEHDPHTDGLRGRVHKQYANWQAGRYSAPDHPQRWTIDSNSPHLTDDHDHLLRGPFERVAWRMMGPFDAHGREQDPSALVEHGETWHPTDTYHLLKIWRGSATPPLHIGIKFLGLHEPGHRQAGESAQVLR